MEVVERACPELVTRLRRDPEQPRAPAAIKRVYVLSRITLGADVAVTSVLMDAAKNRYPDAEIMFVGPRKNFELWEGDPRIRHFPAPYARTGSLHNRLNASASLWFEDGIVIDPDSRLSQLGLISVCPESNYFLFESRSYASDRDDALPSLAALWAWEMFGVECRPYVTPLLQVTRPYDITVSLGVGENQAKRLDDAFEKGLFRALAATGASVLVDKGGTPDERERVERAVVPGIQTHDGAFAAFAPHIGWSRLYIGYDSAGGHVASACGNSPLIIARGFLSDRMRQRWTPLLATVIDGDAPDVLDQVRRALATCTFRR